MTYGHSDIMQLFMYSFRTRSLYLLYLYMHIFMSHVLVITVHAYIDRGITATGNIWLAVDATQRLCVAWYNYTDEYRSPVISVGLVHGRRRYEYPISNMSFLLLRYCNYCVTLSFRLFVNNGAPV